jgi:hypothetical protein
MISRFIIYVFIIIINLNSLTKSQNSIEMNLEHNFEPV